MKKRSLSAQLGLVIASAVLLSSVSACSSTTLPDAASLDGVSGIQSGAALGQSNDLNQLINDFSVLSYTDQQQAAQDSGNQDLQNFLGDMQQVPPNERPQRIREGCHRHPQMMNGVRPPRQDKPPRMSKEELAAQYPELAAQLEAIHDLAPEERKAAMDALIEAHPEWKELIPPPPRNQGAQDAPPPADNTDNTDNANNAENS